MNAHAVSPFNGNDNNNKTRDCEQKTDEENENIKLMNKRAACTHFLDSHLRCCTMSMYVNSVTVLCHSFSSMAKTSDEGGDRLALDSLLKLEPNRANARAH